MGEEPNTVFLRLEGPLQAWGDNSKFVIRRTMEAPTKSGVMGLICCAMGLSRSRARSRLKKLDALVMAVRMDRPGVRWWDYHTAGAGYGLLTAAGQIKRTASTEEFETLITRREYLADASFLVALQGDSALVGEVTAALRHPIWPVYLGRKSCPPSVPVLAWPLESESWTNPGIYRDLPAALEAVPWHARVGDKYCSREEKTLDCLVEWIPSEGNPEAPYEAEVWYDRAISFDPPVHEPRLVVRTRVKAPVAGAIHEPTPHPMRPRADYRKSEYRDRRGKRLDVDQGLCVFCKSPAVTVHHVTYRRAGGNERTDDLRSLCRLCHDAVTMLEYGMSAGLDRLDPCEPRWREDILRKRREIIAFRSLQTRRRRLKPEEVE